MQGRPFGQPHRKTEDGGGQAGEGERGSLCGSVADGRTVGEPKPQRVDAAGLSAPVSAQRGSIGPVCPRGPQKRACAWTDIQPPVQTTPSPADQAQTQLSPPHVEAPDRAKGRPTPQGP